MSDDKGSEGMAELRKALDASQKRVGELESQLRTQQVREIFRDSGYSPKHADLFVSQNPSGDVTAEAVVNWAAEYDLPTVETAEPPAGEPAKEPERRSDSNLAGMAGGGSRAGEGGAASADAQTISRQEWEELQRTNPAAAREALAQRRVRLRADNPWVQTQPKSGTVGRANPYGRTSDS